MGTALWRVASDSGVVVDHLRGAWPHDVVDSDALLGFQVTRPSGDLWVLLSRWGRVLARSTSLSAITATLDHHIAALGSAAPPAGALRFELRSVRLSNGSLALLGPFVAESVTLPERRLSQLGMAIVDSPYVDIDIASGDCLPTSGAANLPSEDESPGHCALLAPTVLAGLLWPSVDGLETAPSPGQVAHALTTCVRSGTKAERIDLAIAIAAALLDGDRFAIVDGTKVAPILTRLSQFGQ